MKTVSKVLAPLLIIAAAPVALGIIIWKVAQSLVDALGRKIVEVDAAKIVQ